MSEITDISINDYAEKVRPTDKLTELRPVLKGLFGEVGSLITVSKKQDREGDIFKAYQGSFSEELGDVFWYITCLLYTSPSPRDLSTSRMPSSA